MAKYLIAQDPYAINYDIKDGLPSSEVYDLHVDQNGLIWMTTDRGICTYNGYEFKSYTTQDGLSNNTNFEIFEAPDGKLWFTAIDGSLSYYEEGMFYAFEQNELLKTITSGRWITNLIIQDQQLIFSTIKFQDYFFTINLATRKIEQHYYKDRATLHSDSPLGKTYVLHFGKEKMYYNEDFYFNTSRLQISDKQEFVLVYDNAIIIKNDTLDYFDFFKNVFVDHFHLDQKGDLWAGTDQGLFRFKNAQIKSAPEYYFKDLSITSLEVDRDGNYWISSLEKGLFFVPSFEVRSLDVSKQNFPSEKIIGIGELGRGLLFGTSQGRILTLQKPFLKEGSFSVEEEKFRKQSFQNVGDAILTQSYAAIALPTEVKIILSAHQKRLAVEVFFNEKYSFAFNAVGLRLYEKGEKVFSLTETNSSARRKRITSVLLEKDTTLLLGTMEGLYRMNIHNFHDIEHLSQQSPLLKTRISFIHPFQEKQYWISTIGNGLLYYTRDTVVQIKTADGLQSDIINHLVIENDSTLWIASNKGLNKVLFSLEKELPIVRDIQTYTTNDGLHSNYINNLKFWKGHLWLATNNGVNYLKTKDLPRSFAAPIVHLEAVETIVGNKVVTNKETLPFYQNDLVFQYTGISFSKPENKAFYRYRLVENGEKGEWFYTNERSARFTNLAAGEYQFVVEARNKQNVWSEQTAKFEFSIRPHFSATWWFRGLIGGSILLLIAYIWINRARSVRQKQRLQEALYRTKDAELAALRNQMNPHFVYNALNSIQNYIFKNDIENANHYLTQFSRLMRSILELSKLEHISLQREVEFLQNYMELEQMRFPNQFDFQITLDEKISLNSYFIPPLLLQPILENSVKYAFKNVDYKGLIEVKIQMTKTQEQLQLVVQDNGSGISTIYDHKNGDAHRSYGLEIIKNRIKILKENGEGSIHFSYGNRVEGRGFVTIFLLPIIENTI